MKKTRLELPDRFTFTTDLNARITDMNYGGHMGYDALVGILHEARIQFLKSFGCNELEIFGASLMMVDAVVICSKEIFAGDIMTIEIAATHLSRMGFDCFYRVNVNGEESARAKTGMIFFDYEKRSIKPAPKEFAEHCV